MVSAETGMRMKISARKVEFRILLSSSNFFFGIELGEDGEGGDADGLADQAERNAH